MTISSEKNEFSAQVPAESIVIKDERGTIRTLLSSAEVKIDITRSPAGRYVGPARVAGTPFKLKKMSGSIRLSDQTNRYSVSVDAVSPKYNYSVRVYGKRADDPKIMRFLTALHLEGKPLATVAGSLPYAAADAFDMDDLKNSPIVEEYLKKPKNKGVVVRFDEIDRTIPIYRGEEPGLSSTTAGPVSTRSLIVLKMPLPAYTDQARMRGISGAVRVVVTFSANGTIGAITADQSLDKSLANSAVEAAKGIKFIPALVDDKPVDVRRILVYNFNVY